MAANTTDTTALLFQTQSPALGPSPLLWHILSTFGVLGSSSLDSCCIILYCNQTPFSPREGWGLGTSERVQTKKIKFCSRKKLVIQSSLRIIERYTYCLGYLYLTPRYGFPKSNGTVPTFYNKIQWRGWHCTTSFKDQVHTTPHPVLNFSGDLNESCACYDILYSLCLEHNSSQQWYQCILW